MVVAGHSGGGWRVREAEADDVSWSEFLIVLKLGWRIAVLWERDWWRCGETL